jgi:hypothetical protein
MAWWVAVLFAVLVYGLLRGVAWLLRDAEDRVGR